MLAAILVSLWAQCGTGGVAVSYRWPQNFTTVPRKPPCTDEEDCLWTCFNGAVTGGTAMECALPDGGSAGTVTDPGGATIYPYLDTGMTQRWITGTTAPSVILPVADAMMNSDAGYTIVMAGSPDSSVAQYNYWLSTSDATGGTIIRAQSGQTECIEATITLGVGQPQDRQVMVASGWNGSTGYRCWVDGVTVDKISTVTRAPMTGGNPWYLGTRPARDLNLSGGFAWINGYRGLKTSVQLNVMQQKFWGSYNASAVAPMAGGTVGVQGVDFTSLTGLVDMIPSSQWADYRGMRTERAHRNYWAIDPQAAGSMVPVGTPTITSNVLGGPFRFVHNDTPCDLISDDDDSGFEGVRSLDAGLNCAAAATGQPVGGCWANASAYVFPGSSGTSKTHGSIRFNTNAVGSKLDDGGTTLECPFDTNPDGGVSRPDCRIRLTSDGGTTWVNAELVVGRVPCTTGSLHLCQAQLTEGLPTRAPLLDLTARGSGNYQLFPIQDKWPLNYKAPSTFASGRYEIVYTAAINPMDPWGYDAVAYLFDASLSNAAHVQTLLFGGDTAGSMLDVFRSPFGSTDDLSSFYAGIANTPGVMYAAAQGWVHVGGGKCYLYAYTNACTCTPCTATTLIASSETGLKNCPDMPTVLNLMRRYNSGEANPTDGYLHSFTYNAP